MKMVAINKAWAVFEDDGVAEPSIDALSALDALLSVRTYKELLEFLITFCCKRGFAFSSDNLFRDWDDGLKVWPEFGYSNEPAGSLASALEKYPEIDYLDALTAADLDESSTFDVSILELIGFRDTIKSFLTVAAVAMGSAPPTGLFEEVETGTVFAEDWWNDIVGTDFAESKTFLLDLHHAGVERHGIFDPWFFENSVFDAYARFDRYPDGCSSPGVVLYSPDCDGERDLTDYVSVTSVHNDPSSIGNALKICAGSVVEVILNHMQDLTECSVFTFPPMKEEDFDRYAYDPQKGFIEKESQLPDTWFEMLLAQSARLIVDGKIKLCPQCGTPVIVKDQRGRFEKEFCSNRCKTASSKSRREYAIRLASSGVSIEKATSLIGEKHRKSVEKWYAEILDTDPAR